MFYLTSFLWSIQILDFSASGQATSLVASGTASDGASTLLWTKTQQLPEEAFRQLHSIYSDHFPIEARHHLAGKYIISDDIFKVKNKYQIHKASISISSLYETQQLLELGNSLLRLD